MITEDYVSFETAKLLKEKGFNEECRAFWKVWNSHTTLFRCTSAQAFDSCYNSILKKYNDEHELNIAAPTLQMAMKWLREVHKIEIRVIYDNERLSWYGACNPMNELSQILLGFGRKSKSYEEACEEAIRYCLQKLI